MNVNGLGMIFKSLGFDPEKIKAQIAEAVGQAKSTVEHFDKRLQAIEFRMHRIEQKLGIDANDDLKKAEIIDINKERNATNG